MACLKNINSVYINIYIYIYWSNELFNKLVFLFTFLTFLPIPTKFLLKIDIDVEH